jgi:hypothetical protein
VDFQDIQTSDGSITIVHAIKDIREGDFLYTPYDDRYYGEIQAEIALSGRPVIPGIGAVSPPPVLPVPIHGSAVTLPETRDRLVFFLSRQTFIFYLKPIQCQVFKASAILCTLLVYDLHSFGLTQSTRTNHLANLEKDGYFVLRQNDLVHGGAPQDLPTPISSNNLKLSEHTNGGTLIFQRFLEGFRSNSGDGLRHQFNPSLCTPLSLVADYVERVGASFFPNLIPSSRTAVVSLPGCKTQGAHMDSFVALPAVNAAVNIATGVTKLKSWEENRPISVLYCVDEHAYVHVWPGTHQDSFEIIKSWWRRRLNVAEAAAYDREIESARKDGDDLTVPEDKKTKSVLLRLNRGDMVFFTRI